MRQARRLLRRTSKVCGQPRDFRRSARANPSRSLLARAARPMGSFEDLEGLRAARDLRRSARANRSRSPLAGATGPKGSFGGRRRFADSASHAFKRALPQKPQRCCCKRNNRIKDRNMVAVWNDPYRSIRYCTGHVFRYFTGKKIIPVTMYHQGACSYS